MYNASSRKDIRRAEKEADRAELAKVEFLRSSLSTIGGREWFYQLLESCHMFSDPFTGNPYQEAFLKGERNVGLRIFADIVQYCPDQYISMMKDANGRRTEQPKPERSHDPDLFDAPDPSAAEYSGSTGSRWNSEDEPYLEPTVGDA